MEEERVCALPAAKDPKEAEELDSEDGCIGVDITFWTTPLLALSLRPTSLWKAVMLEVSQSNGSGRFGKYSPAEMQVSKERQKAPRNAERAIATEVIDDVLHS